MQRHLIALLGIVFLPLLPLRAAHAQATATSAAPAPALAAPLSATAPIPPNTVAQVLAGVTPQPGHPVVDRLVASPEWKEHREWSQARWAEVNRRLESMRTWRDAELKVPDAARRTLLYPFSGPDFLNADALFPTHPKLVFFSLERAGTLPDIAKLDGPQFARMLADVRHALSDIFERNYFITSYMTKQLSTPQIRGTIPVIALMMALTGNRILSIEPIDPFPELTTRYTTPLPRPLAPAEQPVSAGTTGATAAAAATTPPSPTASSTATTAAVPTAPAPTAVANAPASGPASPAPAAAAAAAVAVAANGAAASAASSAPKAAAVRMPPRPRIMLSGARIQFARPGGPTRTLDYYGLDATDKELKWYPQFLEMAMGGSTPATALIKSASYLLHDHQFAGTRAMLLKSADIIVQDDTGIPLRFLKSAGMTVDLYGQYMIPIKPMTYATQPDLEVAYREAGDKVKPIDFPFGYHGRSGKSGLMLARRKP